MADDISPPDYSTSIGLIRALIPDVEEVDWENDGNASYLFHDRHLSGFLSLYPSDTDGVYPWQIKRAAADAVAALAVSEVLISKVIKTEDLQTDGAKVANALFARVTQLRQEADADEENHFMENAFTVVNFEAPLAVPLQEWNIEVAAWKNIFS